MKFKEGDRVINVGVRYLAHGREMEVTGINGDRYYSCSNESMEESFGNKAGLPFHEADLELDIAYYSPLRQALR